MMDILEKQVLPFVDKPARYTGGEMHSIIKDHTGKTSIALIYPDAYEVGISNVGLKILYHLLNSRDEFVCERAYAPWGDFEVKLRELNLPLYSLETKKPLAQFDIVGFSFQYELLYTNFLNILDLSKIPLRSKDRNGSHPLIIGGGPVSCNLEPVAHFLDAICVGDGESRIIKITKAVRESKAKKEDRKTLLEKLSQIDGVYVPSMYEEKEIDGLTVPIGKKVRRFAEPDLNLVSFPGNQILPNIQAVQDRAVVEVARGCTRGCRFCQAGIGYRPVRERNVSKILELARNSIKATGYREFSLISLSISDYSRLPELIKSLDAQFSPHGVSFSLPSLRLDSFTMELAEKVREIRKSGLTFAVEGGTQGIRDAINKGVVEEELLEVIRIAKKLGWKSVKLYFMIGLPADGVDEIEGISTLVERICREIPGFNITVSTAVFIPKPHTPFQWEAQMTQKKAYDEFGRLLTLLKKRKNVNIRFNSSELSFVEGIFSRGDRKLSYAIETAFKNGARFDGWNEFLKIDAWKEALAQNNIDPEIYLKEKNPALDLPWDAIDCGVTKEFLLNERQKSFEYELTKDCRDTCANACGCCDFAEIEPKNAVEEKEPVIQEDFLKNVRMDALPKALGRILYTKTDALKYLSPIDFEELLSRALIRADLPVSFTRGYNPHIRVELGWALPIGFSSIYETAEFDLAEMMGAAELMKILNSVLPSGVKILDTAVFSIPRAHLSKMAKEHFVSFETDCPLPEAEIKINLEKSKEFKKVTSKTEKIVDLTQAVRSISFTNGRMKIDYLQMEGGARIQDVILALTGMDVRHAVTLNPVILKRYLVADGKETGLFLL